MVSPLKLRLYRLKTKITRIIFVLSVLYFPFSLNCAQSPKYIRVAIIQDASYFRLKIKGFYEVIGSADNRVLYRGKNLNTTVTAYKWGILLGKIKYGAHKLFIKPSDPDALLIDGRKFRGDIQFIKKDNLKILVINYIDLDDYIKGILYHEASHYWPQEALKAQAIVCRTYSVYQMQENKFKDFDVTSDIYSQVYGGMTSERYRTNKAVDDTTGYILNYKGEIFPAYYHATCAGNTEDASLLWNIDIVPLKGVTCGFCKDSPHFSWHYVLSADDVQDKLVNAGYKINNIKDIVILGRDKSGRITDLQIQFGEEEIKIPAKDFRNIIGPNIIRSTNFTVNVVKGDVVFEGFGWGHGVGFCQWGAYFMAKAGYKYDEILKFYYPGTELSLIQ